MTWLKGYRQRATGPGGDTQAPSAPANLTAPSTTSSSISLAWTASTDNVGVTGYQILRAPGASGGTFAQIGTSTTNSFVNSGLAASTTFRYQVRAVDAAGNARRCRTRSPRRRRPAAAGTRRRQPRRRTSRHLRPRRSSVSLSWNASTDNVGVTGYQVLRAPGASGGTFTQIGTSTSTSFVNTGSRGEHRRTATRCGPPTRPATSRRCPIR